MVNFKSTVVGLEVITAGVNTTIISSKIDERGENFPVRSEAITAKVGTMIVSSVIDKI